MTKAATTAKPPAERIIEAGYACFEENGIAKTTIEDIASRAGVTRPTVYKYFAGKDALVERITEIESLKVSAELRRRVVRRFTLEDTLTECLLITVRVAGKNVYLRRVLEDIDFVGRAALPASEYHQQQVKWWGSLLRDGVNNGLFSADLSLDDLVSWLTLAKLILLIKIDAAKLSDAELRAFIKRFLVMQLFADPAPANSGRSRKRPRKG